MHEGGSLLDNARGNARTIDDVTPDQPEFRLSDAERSDAIDALGEHLSSGRLDIDEYGERSARVTAAKTRRELAGIFADLPDPHPAVLQDRLPALSADLAPAPRPPRDLAQRIAPMLVPAAAVLSLVLFFTVARGFFPIFLLPVIVALLAGATLGRGYR